MDTLSVEIPRVGEEGLWCPFVQLTHQCKFQILAQGEGESL
jgi:hypothetical protein